MVTPNTLLIGKDPQGRETRFSLSMANRHGLISGATGTGKTVTLQVLAEGLARNGVSVFMADVKGDLSGIASQANINPKIQERIDRLGLKAFEPRGNPVVFWDIFGKKGHALRTTISEMGPLLLSRLLNLNDTQEGVIYLTFRVADDRGLLLLDLKDLRAMLTWVAEHAEELRGEYGNVSATTVGAIQRQLLVLEEAGAEGFFGEPALKLEHLLQRDFSGIGVIGLLEAGHLMQDPRVYTSFMLYLLSELFEQLPEVGDQEKPKLVFFFDEAHLLFNGASDALLEKIEQVVRLIRSKGVGVYFVTQNPLDVPETVLGQLGTRIQHALRAFTPKDQKAVRAAAQTFRQNPELDTEQAITELGVGEALVSVLDTEGRPTPVMRVLIPPPESRIGPLSPEELAERIGRSPLAGIYEQALDRESAYEALKKKEETVLQEAPPAKAKETFWPAEGQVKAPPAPRGRPRESLGEAMAKSAARSVGSSLGRQILRGVLGSIFGGGR